MKYRLVVALVIALFVLPGCGSDDSKSTTSPTTSDAAATDDNATSPLDGVTTNCDGETLNGVPISNIIVTGADCVAAKKVAADPEIAKSTQNFKVGDFSCYTTGGTSSRGYLCTDTNGTTLSFSAE